MKKIISIFFLLSVIFLPVSSADAYVNVKGYYRSNGTYVSPHVRSEPNGLKYDNYGWKPSQGLYNSSYGTKGSSWDTPTWSTDPDYYVGKSIYDSNHRPSGMSKREYLNQYGSAASNSKPFSIGDRPKGMSKKEYKKIYGK